MPRQIQGSQTDFSFGEVDVALKRADDHPARKAGLRQMVNARILNPGSMQNRSGRRAIYPIANAARIEKFTMSAGNDFSINFGNGRVQIVSTTGVVLANFTLQGNGAALPWTAINSTNFRDIVYAIFGLQIFITFGHSMVPQVITWDGVATWSIADYAELVTGFQKRTPFYRISPLGITLLPAAQTGANIQVTASAPLFKPAWVGTRFRWIGRQMLVTAFNNDQVIHVTIEESLPGSQNVAFATDPALSFSVGDVVRGSASGSKGIITSMFGGTTIVVQLLTSNTTSTTGAISIPGQPTTQTFAFVSGETVAGPGGSIVASSVGTIALPVAVAIWDDEVMNAFRGYPASCFTDQYRVGFCDFPAVPGGISWSAINSPNDIYVGPNPNDGMFEIAPGKVQVRYVVAGPESSEFVFCDTRIYYIPISPTNPLKPGSVQFQVLSSDGSAQVQPRVSQELILYVNAGGTSVMAILASGAYYRPFNTKNLTDFHGHLFSSIKAIAVPTADNPLFSERYAYVLNTDGSVVIGKYTLDNVTTAMPKIGWGPWSGTGVVNWVDAWNAEVHFTSSYFGTAIYEILDDAQYLDCALSVNAPPGVFIPPFGKGPLWFIPSQSVTLIDQVTRFMGTYQIDANGFIVPQNNGGENLAAASLVAGQPWTMTVEPFAPDATSGADMGQRMKMRQFGNDGFAAYVLNSTGFFFASLFSAKQLPTSPPLGTIQQTRRVPAWNMDDDPTLPPKLRETVERWSPPGASFDPRAAIIKDTPGPLLIAEIAMEISI